MAQWKRTESPKSEPNTVCERAGRHIQVNEVTADAESRDFICSACGAFWSTN